MSVSEVYIEKKFQYLELLKKLNSHNIQTGAKLSIDLTSVICMEEIQTK